MPNDYEEITKPLKDAVNKLIADRKKNQTKAFRVWCPWFNDAYNCDHYSIILGESAGKVRYQKWLDIEEIFPGLKIMDIKVVRAPEFDTYTPSEKIHDGCTVGWLSVKRDTLETESYGSPIRLE